jgi:hypothetical protein
VVEVVVQEVDGRYVVKMKIVQELPYYVIINHPILRILYQSFMHQLHFDLGQIPSVELLEVVGIWNLVLVLQLNEIDLISVSGLS